MNEKYYVICGTRQEFNEFIQKKALELFKQGDDSVSLSQFVYVNSTREVAGIENPHGWFVGSWRQRSNIHEIVQQIIVRYTLDNIPDTLKKIYYEVSPSNSNP